MQLAFLDAGVRAVCSAAACADGLWGPAGRVCVQVCLDMLAEAISLGQLLGFAMLELAIMTFHGGAVVAVRHQGVEIIVSPIDEHGVLLPISVGASIAMLADVAYLRVLRVSWQGRGVNERKIA